MCHVTTVKSICHVIVTVGSSLRPHRQHPVHLGDHVTHGGGRGIVYRAEALTEPVAGDGSDLVTGDFGGLPCNTLLTLRKWVM